MPVVNLDEFSVPELRELIKDVEVEIKKREEENRKHVVLKMRELAAEVGMTVDEVLGIEKTKGAKTKLRAKYQNPDNPDEMWTGRGKRPGWMKDLLAAGNKLEELEIR